jgi:glucosamine--fructose-6-phosphate aminotransferase (isomerizing)
MCGIFGVFADYPVLDSILNGLTKLEYRGYDSSGVSVLDSKNKIKTIRSKGKLKNLKNKLNGNKINGNIGIGHTRWATHGVPNNINAHPHYDSSEKFSLIHNGIIENYIPLKKFLESKGYTFKSKTDTEVLVQFISYIYNKEKISFFDSVRLALKEVVGAYGIVVMHKESPDTLIAARNGSPLIVGLSKDEKFVSSDVSAVLEYTRNILYLEDGEIISLDQKDYTIKEVLSDKIISKDIHRIEMSLDKIEKGGFDHFMLKEIYEQPNSIKDSIRGRIRGDEIMLGGIYDKTQEIIDSNHIYITACGTSWHAAQIGSYILEELLKKPVKVEYASEFRYRNAPIDSNSLVIAISQSGETADTLAAIKKAKEAGSLTLGIVNAVGSSIARETDCGIYMHAGPEIGVASTKAFTSQVVILNMLALYLANKMDLKTKLMTNTIEDLKILERTISKVLKLDGEILDIAKKYYTAENFLYLGRGYQFPSALEGALKLKEISYIHAEGYPAAEMKHGPIALIDEKMPVVFIVTPNGYSKILSNIQEVKARGGKIIIITLVDPSEMIDFVDHIIHIKDAEDISNSLSPILTSVPLQLLAYHIAVLKGCNVDQPRNLAKSVTVE